MLKKLTQALEAKDYVAVTACFASSKDVQFIDFCPTTLGDAMVALYGAKAIEMWFRNEFYFFNKNFDISAVRYDDRGATFFARYKTRYCFARLTVDALTEDGKILRATIRPE